MKLSTVFSNHMVLNAGMPIYFFGEGCGTFSADLAGKHVETVCADGVWQVEFPALPAGGPYDLAVCTDGETHTYTDVYLGRVVLFSGQSNVQFKLGESGIDTGTYVSENRLRMYHVDLLRDEGYYFKSAQGWHVCDQTEVGHWSALAYYTGLALCQKYPDTVIGVMCCSQGASTIESWLPAGMTARFGVPEAEKHPDHREPDYAYFNGEGDMFREMLSKIVPYGFGNLVWYQGESDTTVAEAKVYDREIELFFGLVKHLFHNDGLRFTVVQIADFDGRRDEGWRALQEAQTRIPARVPNTCLVRIADVCETAGIHPKDKRGAARRIAETI